VGPSARLSPALSLPLPLACGRRILAGRRDWCQCQAASGVRFRPWPQHHKLPSQRAANPEGVNHGGRRGSEEARWAAELAPGGPVDWQQAHADSGGLVYRRALEAIAGEASWLLAGRGREDALPACVAPTARRLSPLPPCSVQASQPVRQPARPQPTSANRRCRKWRRGREGWCADLGHASSLVRVPIGGLHSMKGHLPCPRYCAWPSCSALPSFACYCSRQDAHNTSLSPRAAPSNHRRPRSPRSIQPRAFVGAPLRAIVALHRAHAPQPAIASPQSAPGPYLAKLLCNCVVARLSVARY